jgi:hypothetical protein
MTDQARRMPVAAKRPMPPRSADPCRATSAYAAASALRGPVTIL